MVDEIVLGNLCKAAIFHPLFLACQRIDLMALLAYIYGIVSFYRTSLMVSSLKIRLQFFVVI